MANTPLRRSSTNRMIAGVCGGLAEHLGMDPTLMRVIFVVVAVFGGSSILIYILLALLMPEA